MALVRWRDGSKPQTVSRGRAHDLECFLNDVFGNRERWYRPEPKQYEPRINLMDTPEAFVLKAYVPGYGEDDLNVSISSDIITIKGTYEEASESSEDCYFCRESFGAGAFERSVPLPQPVVADGSNAELSKGILTITLPKEQPQKAVTISVN